MVEYATLENVKDYLSIPQSFLPNDGKLRLILEGVNAEIETLTGEAPTNSKLKLGACKWVEINYNKPTGVSAEGDGDFKRSFETQKTYIPPEVLGFIKDFLTPEAKIEHLESSKPKAGIQFARARSY